MEAETSKGRRGHPTRDEVFRKELERVKDEALAIISSQLEAARARTARLKELRLAQEAAKDITDLDRKRP